MNLLKAENVFAIEMLRFFNRFYPPEYHQHD